MPPFRRRHFQMYFLECKCWIAFTISLKFVPKVSNQQYSSIGLDNGLAPTRCKVIIWTKDSWFTEAYLRHSVSMTNLLFGCLLIQCIILTQWRTIPDYIYIYIYEWSNDITVSAYRSILSTLFWFAWRISLCEFAWVSCVQWTNGPKYIDLCYKMNHPRSKWCKVCHCATQVVWNRLVKGIYRLFWIVILPASLMAKIHHKLQTITLIELW